MSEHVQFVEAELQSILQAGEQVQVIGVTMGSKSLLVSWIIKKLKRYYYTVFTDRRLILIRAKTKNSLFGTKFIPANKGVITSELADLKRIIRARGAVVVLLDKLFGFKAYVIEGSDHRHMLSLRRKVNGLPQQGDLYDRFVQLVAQPALEGPA